jgi:hypothetical protein
VAEAEAKAKTEQGPEAYADPARRCGCDPEIVHSAGIVLGKVWSLMAEVLEGPSATVVKVSAAQVHQRQLRSGGAVPSNQPDDTDQQEAADNTPGKCAWANGPKRDWCLVGTVGKHSSTGTLHVNLLTHESNQPSDTSRKCMGYLADVLNEPRADGGKAIFHTGGKQGGEGVYPAKRLTAAGYSNYGPSHLPRTGSSAERNLTQAHHTLVLDGQPNNSSAEQLLGQPAVSNLARAVEIHIEEALGGQGSIEYLQLTHGHMLNQTSPAASFRAHTDTEENISYDDTQPPRLVQLTAVILLRKGNTHLTGDSGVRVHGAKSDGYFTQVGDCHIFPSDMWHESVNTYTGDPASGDGIHGDLKLTLFWGSVFAKRDNKRQKRSTQK